ncbi:MAG: bifunctional aspartate kinase/homoserine dehydrogenase I [Gammaproteobacteria bacterium]|nr:MAG: bifunctional aspartate kinase/homoserine dehydrogenase I [Gammaproteobacteria bacterium]
MRVQPWSVHKFGGSSLADASCFRRVADIIEKLPQPRVAVVLSACRGVTDELIGIVSAAEKLDEQGYMATLERLRARHTAIAEELLSEPARGHYLERLSADLADLQRILYAVSLVRSAGREVRDVAAGYGELWSSRLFAAWLAGRGRRSPVVWTDARDIVIVEWGPLGPRVQWERTRELVRERVAIEAEATLVIPGYVATDARGVQTTLGRNGSDFSASIFGALLDAGEIVIWTDVDGVLSADPRRVPDAKVIDSMSYNEAMELAYFGAKVIHPQTMAPAIAGSIPIRICNTFAPEHPGTLIQAHSDSKLVVKGITSVEDTALVNVEGAGMIGVPGTAHRLFGALREAEISVVLISQGSSEHSICFAIPAAQAAAAERVVRAAFATELREGQIQSVEVSDNCSIVAVVGDGMAGAHGIAGKLFGALGNAGVNVRAIAQGASERNISVVVDRRDAAKALRAVHSGFYLSPHTLSIGLIGPGTVGSVLLEQLASQSERLRRDCNLDLRVRGIASSRRMLLTDRAIDLANWRQEMAAHGEPLDIERFAAHVAADHLPHRVMIDCTADAGVAARYAEWFHAGLHVVTPNKKAHSAAIEQFRAMQEARRQAGTHYLYEATVGAGLPIMLTVRDLRETGDEIRAIDGIFSGTLAYLFNVFDGSVPFSTIVADARARGFTEPDPRDDLSGTDVARKLVILGREMGLAIGLEEVVVESLVPEALRGCTVAEFLERLPAHDERMRALVTDAKREGKVLRYVGRLTADGRATVGLERLDGHHAFANISLTDNIVRFMTARYCDNPLIVQGPGAGPAVTAGGVFGDLLRLASYLGARI